jgi:alpha-ribazole phosphatase CobZ
LAALELGDRYLIMNFGAPRHVLTTAHPEGLVRASKVAIYQVTDSDDISRPEKFKEGVRRALGLSASDPVMLTAADVSRYRSAVEGDYGVVATVGLSHPSCHSMRSTYAPLMPSTINIVAWVPDRLTASAMVDLLRVVAETKAAASADLMLRCDGGRATGTVSDAIAVAATLDPSGALWAGQATTVGSKVASLVYRAIVSEKPSREQVLSWALGLSLEELVDDAMKLYRSAPVPGVAEGKVKEMVARELSHILQDPNVWAFIVAARENDIRGQEGLLPGLGSDEFAADTKKVIADELLATALSLYINGFKALTATYWADTMKDRLGLKLASLPMFEDDIAASLAASALSRVYDRLLGEGHD